MEKNVVEQLVVPRNRALIKLKINNEISVAMPKGGVNRVGIFGVSNEFSMKTDNIVKLKDEGFCGISKKLIQAFSYAIVDEDDCTNGYKYRADITLTFFGLSHLGLTPKAKIVAYTNDETFDPYEYLTEVRYTRNYQFVPFHIVYVRMSGEKLHAAYIVSKSIVDRTYYDITDVSVSLNEVEIESTLTKLQSAEAMENLDKITEGLDAKLDKIKPVNNMGYAYGVGYLGTGDKFGNLDGIPYLRNVTISSSPWCIVARDENAEIAVSASPKKGSSAISLTYLSLKLNPINRSLGEITRRMDSVEHASIGNIYENITLDDVGESLQVDNACPWGIFSRLGCIAKLRCILPYQLSASSNLTPTGVNSFGFTDRSTYIRCDIPAGTTFKIAAESVGEVKRFGISSIAGSSGFDTSIGNKGYFAVNEFVTATKDCSYIFVEKGEKEYTNFKVVFASGYVPTNAITEISEIEVPEYIRGLSGYNIEGAYLDLIEKKLYAGSYSPQDIDVSGLDDIINLPLLPGMIVQFIGTDGKPKEVQYELTYKNKI